MNHLLTAPLLSLTVRLRKPCNADTQKSSLQVVQGRGANAWSACTRAQLRYQTGLFSITTFQLASYSMDMHIHMQSLFRLLICLQMSDVSLHKHMQMQTAKLPPCT